MSMDLIPDDCLLHIFKLIHDTHTLFRFLRVCKRWNRLVSYRLARAERLLDDWVIRDTQLDVKSLCFDVKAGSLVEQILSKIIKKSPKLKVVSVGLENMEHEDPNWLQKCVDCLFKLESLEGLMLSACWSDGIDTIPQSIKYLVSENTNIKTGLYPRVKHLIVQDDIFTNSIQRFPNVEWLNLSVVNNVDPNEWYGVACKNQHLFKNLKVLEIDTTWEEEESAGDNLAVKFIDFCPQLESAHIKIAADHKVPGNNFRHKNLTNLVITYLDFELLRAYLPNLLRLLRRFPNIKYLAIKRHIKSDPNSSKKSGDSVADGSGSDDMDGEEQRESKNMDSDDSGIDGDVEVEAASREVIYDKSKTADLLDNKCLLGTILLVLKKLVLLDMRGLSSIDQSVAEFVQYLFKKNKQFSGKFYYGNTGDDEIKRDWPELFDKRQDSSAFHFMAEHFLPDYPVCNLIQPDAYY